MSIRLSYLSLCLLALLEPALSASPVLSFPIDAAKLAEQICDEDPSEAILRCHAIVKNFDITLASLAPGLAASPLRLAGSEPVVTSCGLWNAMLTIDPIRLRPSSQEVPSLVLEMSTRLRFVNQETGEAVDFTLLPGGGTSPWRLARTGRPSNPVRLVGESGGKVITFDDCIPQWVYNDPNYEVIQEDGCEACPEDEGEAPPPDDEETPPPSDDDGAQSQVVPAEPQP